MRYTWRAKFGGFQLNRRRSWGTESVYYQVHLCKSVCDIKLWKVWWRLWVKAFIWIEGITASSFTIRRRLTELGCKKQWTTWISLNLPSNHDCIGLQIGKPLNGHYPSNYTLQWDVNWMQQLQKKSGLGETPCLRAATKLKQVWPEVISLHFLEFICGSSR